jgi:hypothetical protein
VDAQVVRDFSDSAGKEHQCLNDVDYEAGPEGHDHASLALNAVEEKHEASANNKNGHFLMISLEFHLSRPLYTFVTELTIILQMVNDSKTPKLSKMMPLYLS